MALEPLILQAQGGDLAAYGALVEATQDMVHAVCYRVLRDPADALDAAQETYLRAFQRLGDLREPAAFAGWLRRIAVTTSQNLRRARRMSFLDSAAGDLPTVPVLDELEETWSDSQRHALAAALATLPPEERRLCDRFYHGNWSVARLAADAVTTEAAMRKRLQRIRDKLRKDIEMSELLNTPGGPPANLPAKVVELLAHPRLVDLPENPVGKMADLLRATYAGHEMVTPDEIIDLTRAKQILHHDRKDPDAGFHRVDADRILRPDLTIPMLLAAIAHGLPADGSPLRLCAAGQVYRAGAPEDSMHLEVFHQFELLLIRQGLSPWECLGDLLRVLAALFPRNAVQIEPANFSLCQQSWEIATEIRGRWTSIAGCGLYTDHVVRALGADPATTAAFGAGFGLERLAALKFNYDDLRRLESARLGS